MTSRTLPRSSRLLAGVILASTLVACSGGSEPRTAEQGTEGSHTLPEADVGPDLPAPTPPPSRPPQPRDGDGGESKARGSGTRDDSVVVIEEARSSRKPSLVEAARRAREEREKAPRPKLVITDENLSEYATGDVSIIRPGRQEGEGGEPLEEGSSPEASTAEPQSEEYWRRGARELRLKLRRAWEEARQLDEQAAGLRLRFYAEDDPYVRDSEIKPAWDRALERRRQAELEVKAYRTQLEEFLERGRRAGALPGWLREGIEHEPDLESLEDEQEEALDGFGRHRPVDPESTEPGEDPEEKGRP